MNDNPVTSRLRTWLNDIPIKDPINRHMAALLQVMLIGFIAVIVIAAVMNSIMARDIPWLANLIRSTVAILIIAILLVLLRHGYFRGPVLGIIAAVVILGTYAATVASLREVAETLTFFTLAMILAGLLLGRRALVLTFVLSAGAVGFSAFQEAAAGLGDDGIIIASNFVLLNGLIGLVLDRFGITLRGVLASALERENELQSQIHERMRANTALRESEERYRKLIQSARDVIFTLALDGSFTSLNPSFETFTGWPRDEWLGRSFEGLIAQDDRPRARDYFDRVLRSGTLRAVRLRVPTRTGQTLVVEVNISPQFKEGRVVSLLGIARDMTEEQRAQEALEASEKRFRALIEKSMDGIGLLSDDGRITYASPAVTSILGYAPGELMDRSAFDLLHPEDVQPLADLFARLLESHGASMGAQYRYLHKDGSWRWIEGIGTNLLAEPHVRAIIANYRDITERKQTEQALRESEKRFRALFEQTHDAVLILDLQGRHMTVNQRAADMLGYSLAELHGLSYRDISAELPESEDTFERLLNGEHIPLYERVFRKKNGDRFPVEINVELIRDAMGNPLHIQSVVRDITERKQAEAELRASEARLRTVLETSPMPITLNSLEDGRVLYGNFALADLLGVPLSEIVGRRAVSYYADPAGRSKALAELERRGSLHDYEVQLRRPDGRTMWVSLSTAKTIFDGRACLLSCFHDITERKRAEEEIRRRADEMAALAEIAHDISSTLQLDTVLERIASNAKNLLDAETSAVYLAEPAAQMLRAASAIGPDAEEIKRDPVRVGEGILGNIALQKSGEIVNDSAADPRGITINETEDIPHEHLMGVPVLLKGQLTGLIAVWRIGAGREFISADLDFLNSLAQQAAIAAENARLYEETQKRLREMEAISEANTALSQTLELEPMLENVLQAAIHAISAAERGSVLLADEQGNLHVRAVWGYTDPRVRTVSFQPNSGYSALSFREQRAIIISDVRAAATIRYDGDIQEMLMGGSAMAVPLVVKDRAIGVIAIDTPAQEDAFNERDLYLFKTMASSAALVIENARLFENTRERLADLEILQKIASALRSAATLDQALPIILDQLIGLMNVGSASIDVVDPASGEIVTELARGVWAPVTGMRTPANAGVSGGVISTGRPYITTNVVADGLVMRPDLVGGLNAVACVPIIAQHGPIGALWVGRKTPIAEEEVILLTALGEMVGNTIHRMRLHERTERLLDDLQTANVELAQAYDSTLEGWAKALELRDKETEGHSRRVTNLTLRLASRVGLSESELHHVRRGTLLHDIGKMGIPDQVLKKTGNLNEEEWSEMRRHPQYAYDLIYPIEYLRPALDIPYCHHEHWDGSGYPRGLRGEEIPLAARIFTVVDVWDALLHDRPYRKAWSRQQVVEYMLEQSGRIFDPVILAMFLKMMEEK